MVNKKNTQEFYSKNKKTEKEQLAQIRKEAISEAERLKKGGKNITANAVEVICTEKDIFHTKSNKK